ncbi:MAG: YibE/F family protein [Lactovum sp.]
MNSILFLFLIFVFLLFLVVGKSGIQSLIGLFLNFLMICLFLFLVSRSFPVFLLLPLFVFIILTISIFSSVMDEKIAALAFKSSSLVAVPLLLFSYIIQYWGQFQGFTNQNMEELEGLSLNIGLNFSELTVAVFVLSILGSLAESSIAVIINLKELIDQNPQMTSEEFRVQKRIISEQIIGTAINILFFGLLGGSLAVFLWYIRLERTFAEMINSKLLMIEVAGILIGMIAILLVVELSAYFMEKNFKIE